MPFRKRTTPTVGVHDGVLVKRGDPSDLRIEAMKMEKAREIGVQTGLFAVPRLLDLDETAGTLEMEYIPDLTGFRNVRLGDAEMSALARKAGAALATVHAELTLPNNFNIPLPPEFNGPDKVFIHGDYSGENVCVRSGSDPKIVLIDWQMTGMHGGKATHGSRYFDVAWFINNLFSKPFYRFSTSQDVNVHADAFLFEYAKTAHISDLSPFALYQNRFLDFKIQQRRAHMSKAKLYLLKKGHGKWRSFAEKTSSRHPEGDS